MKSALHSHSLAAGVRQGDYPASNCRAHRRLGTFDEKEEGNT